MTETNPSEGYCRGCRKTNERWLWCRGCHNAYGETDTSPPLVIVEWHDGVLMWGEYKPSKRSTSYNGIVSECSNEWYWQSDHSIKFSNGACASILRMN